MITVTGISTNVENRSTIFRRDEGGLINDKMSVKNERTRKHS